MTRAVVLGGGLSGVLAANVLARHLDEVVVIERDEYPQTPMVRRGVPQGHHSHVLATGGAEALDVLFPGVLDELRDAGAHWRGMPGDSLILTAHGWFRRHASRAYLVSCSRGLLEHIVRGRALSGPRISVREKTAVVGLDGDAQAVHAVRLTRNGTAQETSLEGDLFVDTTGRRTRAERWLRELNGRRVVESTVESGLSYATLVYQAPPDLLDVPAIVMHPRLASGSPGATLYPVEDDRWVVTLTASRGDVLPRTPAEFSDLAQRLPHGLIAALLARANPAGVVRTYRDTRNRRRRFEAETLPNGFFAMGDAVAAVNPIYSHGMSVAAQSALRLDTELATHQAGSTITRRLQAAMAETAETSWQMATAKDAQSADAGNARVQPQSSFERELQLRASRALLGNPQVAARFFEEQALIEPAASGEDFTLLHSMTSAPAPPLLSDDEAIAQFPTLGAYWDQASRTQRRQVATAAPPSSTT